MFTLSCFTGGIAATNGWLLQTGSLTLAVDAPEGFAAWLRVQDERPAALLLTHQHFDHVMDAAAIQADHGCPIYAFAAYSRELTLEALFGVPPDGPMSVPPFAVDQVLAGDGQLRIGGLDFALLHVPGHSPDSLCYHLPMHGLLFGGDVLFLDGIGRTDFPGGSQTELITGIEAKLLTLPDETRVLPGHGDETTIGRERMENPFLEG